MPDSAVATGVDFESRILPVLEKKCFECHQAAREVNGEMVEPKGGLRLDGAKAILRGGENGEVVKPGDVDGSPLYVRISLSGDHDDFMPKEGDALSALEKAFMKRWIQDGAGFGAWVGNESENAVAVTPPPATATETPPATTTDSKPEGTEVAMVPKPTTPEPVTPPPATTSPATTPPPATAATVDFERHLLPILRSKCFECHQAPFEDGGRLKKPKGGLRLDAARGIMQGSSDGPVVTAGNPEDSTIYILTSLPQDDDDAMPPKGDGTPLSETELEVLKKWIEEGANFSGWIGNEEGLASEMAPPSSQGPTAADLLAAQVKGASAEALNAVAATGALITQVAIGNPLLRVEYVTGESQIGDPQIAAIGPLAGNVTELDLSETKVTDGGLAMLGKFDKLTYLDLHSTEITDATIGVIKGLNHLEYLNLYETQVTDASLPAIAGMRKLKAVYLWKTGVTEAGAEKLRKALPDAKINM